MINAFSLNGHYAPKKEMLNALARFFDPEERLRLIPSEMLKEALEVQLSDLDTKLRHGNHLGIVEALGGMLRVIAGTNNILGRLLFPNDNASTNQVRGTFFLTRMAAKEQYIGLTAEEIAGMVLATMLDLVYCPSIKSVAETSGMGADRGWNSKKVKTINASTLTAILLAAMGIRSMKHGSYGNTTKVGSTDVPEQFGANIIQRTPQEVENIINECGFWFNDAHSVKTVHDLSHLLRVETVNHVIGPMTPPVLQSTVLYKMMGVNHYVHPETVAKAYALLHKLEAVNLGGAVIVAGLKASPRNDKEARSFAWYRENCFLDEVSPETTIVSMVRGSELLFTEVLCVHDLIPHHITLEDIKVPNEIRPLMRANYQALGGRGIYAEYLALNVAFAMLATSDTSNNPIAHLGKYFNTAYETLQEGKGVDTLRRYVTVSKGTFIPWD